jgi:hypothetical protein
LSLASGVLGVSESIEKILKQKHDDDKGKEHEGER